MYIVSIDSAVNEYQVSCMGTIGKALVMQLTMYPANWTILSYSLPAQDAAKWMSSHAYRFYWLQLTPYAIIFFFFMAAFQTLPQAIAY